MNELVLLVNERIKTLLDQYPDGTVKNAMYYSLKAGGKRIRPVIVLQVIRSYGLDYHPYIDVACALEMIHTYSLIHDDLPGMDNDDLRRGMPTCHKQFNEAVAILAGDGLLNEAVNIIINAKLEDRLTVELIQCLYSSSGISGMILGQELDIENEGKPMGVSDLEKIHYYKTGKLLACAFKMGGYISHKEDVEVLEKIGHKIGLAFQIQDDVLDVVSDEETLGKPIGSDEKNGKTTYVSLLGIEKSQELSNQLFNEAVELIYSLRVNHGLLLEIVENLRKRVM